MNESTTALPPSIAAATVELPPLKDRPSTDVSGDIAQLRAKLDAILVEMMDLRDAMPTCAHGNYRTCPTRGRSRCSEEHPAKQKLDDAIKGLRGLRKDMLQLTRSSYQTIRVLESHIWYGHDSDDLRLQGYDVAYFE